MRSARSNSYGSLQKAVDAAAIAFAELLSTIAPSHSTMAAARETLRNADAILSNSPARPRTSDQMVDGT
jgi:hypothetical protein